MKEGEMWYAYFKENVPLQVSALSKDALITYIDKKEKICIICSIQKHTTEFYKQIKKEDGGTWEYYDHACKPCRLIQSAQRRKNIKNSAWAHC